MADYTLTIGNRVTGSHAVTSYQTYSEAKRDFQIAAALRQQAPDPRERIIILRFKGATIRQDV